MVKLKKHKKLCVNCDCLVYEAASINIVFCSEGILPPMRDEFVWRNQYYCEKFKDRVIRHEI